MRMAIIEDDPFTAEDLKEQFEKRGWRVVGTAVDSRSARDLINATLPELVLLDVELKDGPTGPSLSTAEITNGALVVFLTGHAEILADQLGESYPVLLKPFREADIDAISIYAHDALAAAKEALN